MKLVRDVFEWTKPHVAPGARFEKLFPFWEGMESFFFTPPGTTTTGPHIRDKIDLKRMMLLVAMALAPCILMALYNTGYQAHLVVEQGGALLDNWQTAVFTATGLQPDSSSILSCIVHGALYFFPVLIVTLIAGGTAEVVFSVIRGHVISEGFFVTGTLIPLIMPPTVPLWMVALGTIFGVVIGKEIFGGTGMNFLNPALTARAFLFFAYPAQLSGEVWVAATRPDGQSGATWLASFAEGSGHLEGFTFMDAFIGRIPGSMGETSVLAVLIGAALLLVTRVAAWQTMLGVLVGTLITAQGLNMLDASTNPMLAMPPLYHLVLGGWAFGAVFMATDPVSSAFTRTGKLWYGFGIGLLCVLIRTVNPAYPEGMMLAILFMNMFAPLIDHAVVNANIRRRAARHGQRTA